MTLPAATSQPAPLRVAVIIPCFRVGEHVLRVLASIGPEVDAIYVVDDACPERSGDRVESACSDPRVRVVRHAENGGVGAAVLTGYGAAIRDGADILVKIDGDGQMDPALLPRFVRPIAEGRADYTKGNRFYDLMHLGRMPGIRLFGNAVLSFFAKLSTGYWNLFDVTNGYTALHARVARHLPFDRISRRYFFETDLLFRLNTIRAVVVDVPMDARYEDETSSLRVGKIIPEFLAKHARNFGKRVFYNYFLRDVSLASLELMLGLALLAFGFGFGAIHWWQSAASQSPASAGTVMLAGLTTLLGSQLMLAFFAYDIASTPRTPIHPLLEERNPAG